MKKILSILILLIAANTSFAQFADTAHLNDFIRNTIKDRRPEKVTASDLQKALLGTANLIPKPAPFINVKDYGAIGDSATDNTITLRNIFSMPEADGAIIFFPKGNYIISDSVLVPYSCKIWGVGGGAPYQPSDTNHLVGTYVGGNSVIIQTSSNKSGLVINEDGSSIDGLTVKCSATTPTAGGGIVVYHGNSMRIQNTYIGDFYSNLVINDGVDIMINNNQFSNPILYNFYLGGTNGDEGCNGVYQNMFNSSRSPIAIQFRADVPAGLRLVDNEYHIATGQAGPYYAFGSIDINCLSATSEPFISGNGIEAYTNFGIRVRCDSSAELGKIHINGNTITSYDFGAHGDIDIKGYKSPSNINYVNISNNILANFGSLPSISLNNIANISVFGNTFSNPVLDYSLINCSNVSFKALGTINLGGPVNVDSVATGLATDSVLVKNGKEIKKISTLSFLHPTGSETADSKWLRNSYTAIPGDIADLGMTGLYDRNELTLVDRRGSVTYSVTGGGTLSSNSNMFDASGAFSQISSATASTGMVVNIDVGSNVSNYNRAKWQPFVMYRLNSGFFKNITVEVSMDSTNWYKPASGWTFDYSTTSFFPSASWFGTEANPDPLINWRYARFTFSNPVLDGSSIYIGELGIRHVSAPYARQYVRADNSGTATLSAGTVTVSATVASTSKILVTVNTPSGTQGFLSVPTASIITGTSFVINSSSATETSTVNWMVVN